MMLKKYRHPDSSDACRCGYLRLVISGAETPGERNGECGK